MSLQPSGKSPLRVAVLAFDDPWASSHGGTLRTRAFVDALSSLGHQVVCVYAGANGTATDAASRVEHGNVVRVGVAAKPWGETAGSGRLGRIKRRYLPMPTVRGGRVGALWNALAGQGSFDYLLVQQLRGVPYLAAVPGAKLWLDQTDLWSEFLLSEIASLSGARRITARMQRAHFSRLELQAVGAATVTSAAGFGDAQLLAVAAQTSVQWLPTAVQQLSSAVARTGSDTRPTAGLLANFAYWPNRDAYDILANSWAPELSAMGWRVVVAGYGSDELPAASGIESWGILDSPEHFYASVDLALSPIRLGGGVKVKVLEALFAGRSVAASPQSLQGFPPGSVPGAVVTSLTEPSFPPARIATHSKVLVSDDVLRQFSQAGFESTVASLLCV